MTAMLLLDTEGWFSHTQRFESSADAAAWLGFNGYPRSVFTVALPDPAHGPWRWRNLALVYAAPGDISDVDAFAVKMAMEGRVCLASGDFLKGWRRSQRLPR